MAQSLLMRRTTTSFVLIAIIVGVAFGIERWLASKAEPPAKAAEIEIRVAVRVAEAKRQDYVEQLTGYGRARSLRRTAVAAEVAGLVVQLAPELEAGNAVRAGQELVWLDDRDRRTQVSTIAARSSRRQAEEKRLRADRANLERQLKIARGELEVAERELGRVRRLVEREVATSSSEDAELLRVTTRQTAVTRLEGELSKNQAMLDSNQAEDKELQVSADQARTDLDRTVIRAPYDGRIELRMVQKGARVAPGVELFRIVDPTRVEVPVALPASRYGEVAVGAEAAVQLPGSRGVSWKASVARLAPTVRADDRTFLVYLESTGEEAVPPGAFVSASISGRRYPDVFVLPRTAFVGDRIFVADGEVARARTPGVVRALPSVVLCRDGIEVGESIIVTNLEQVAEGSRVAPIEGGAGAAGLDDA
ncbi:MAG: efflux RND transporter periplasmic adaptor subunit [Planctomycetota bacterium]